MPCSQNRWGGTRFNAIPSMASVPASTRCTPAMALISVVLPAPFGPTTTASAPGSTLSDTPFTAGAAP